MTKAEFNETFILMIPATIHQNAVLGNTSDELEEDIVYTNEDEIIENTGFIVYYPMDGKHLTRIYESKDGDNIVQEITKVFHIVG
jgi:hypothetical protein